MEDDNIKTLFDNFQPQLSSDFDFMDKLQRNINSVELVKQRNAELRLRSRRAVIIAACVGFAVGSLLSFATPYIGQFLQNMLDFSGTTRLDISSGAYLTIAYVIIGITTALISLNTYSLSFSLLSNKK